MASDSTKRFSNRVRDYQRFRPSYPDDAVSYMLEGLPVGKTTRLADIGAGTGVLTGLLLQRGFSVCAVEPNEPMRQECDRVLAQYNNYTSVCGTAEKTGLENQSIDLITAAQAFHWFDFDQARMEFDRVLKRDGAIALVWNRRDNLSSSFQQEYEELLNSLIPEYRNVTHANVTDDHLREFLGPEMHKAIFANQQQFDLPGLKGRLQSASYCPTPEQDGFVELMSAVDALYARHEYQGKVQFSYTTEVFKAIRA